MFWFYIFETIELILHKKGLFYIPFCLAYIIEMRMCFFFFFCLDVFCKYAHRKTFTLHTTSKRSFQTWFHEFVTVIVWQIECRRLQNYRIQSTSECPFLDWCCNENVIFIVMFLYLNIDAQTVSYYWVIESQYKKEKNKQKRKTTHLNLGQYPLIQPIHHYLHFNSILKSIAFCTRANITEHKPTIE